MPYNDVVEGDNRLTFLKRGCAGRKLSLVSELLDIPYTMQYNEP